MGLAGTSLEGTYALAASARTVCSLAKLKIGQLYVPNWFAILAKPSPHAASKQVPVSIKQVRAYALADPWQQTAARIDNRSWPLCCTMQRSRGHMLALTLHTILLCGPVQAGNWHGFSTSTAL